MERQVIDEIIRPYDYKRYQLKRKHVIIEEGCVIAVEKTESLVLCPGDDLSNYQQYIQDFCNSQWTDEVVEQYNAWKNEQK